MPPTRTIEDTLRETKIYQILRPKLVTAGPTITLQQALDLMHREKAGYIVIADEHLKVVGMFTEREVLMKVLRPGVRLDEPVSKYMRTDVHALSKADTVGTALDAMDKFSIRHVPLVDKFGQMNGVLSVRTIANFLSELFPTEVFNIPPRPQIHETVEGG